MTSFILKFTLDGSKPQITRTVAIPAESSFFDLHRAIQDSFGWIDSHLHEFVVGKQRELIGHTAIPDVKDEREFAIADYQDQPIHYNYDFGDRWETTVEWMGTSEDYLIPTLVDYQEVSPTDDSGGLMGFQMMWKTMSKPDDPNYKETKEWFDNFPPRTREYAEFAVATYLTSGVRKGRRCVKPGIIGEMTQIFTLPFTGDLYLDIENSKVCEMVDSVKQKSRFSKVTRNLLESDPERFAKIEFSFEGLDKTAARMAPAFDVTKDCTLTDTKSVVDASTEDKTEWMTYSITYYVKQILDAADLFIDYGYNGFNPTELSFRSLQNDPASLNKMLEEFREQE
ncbi:MAG: plasmid pRiA4b ORF-3 family protein [Thermoplasmata archaeon]|nr:plasmid pRiA4b ORF-3 family protein [Thermoplasmata archaeon]